MNAATQIVRTLQKGDVQTFKFKEYVRWDNRTGQKILGIRGVHPAARKVVFVAQTATVQPRHGDILLCKVIKDTAPADPKRGALIVAPVVGENIRRIEKKRGYCRDRVSRQIIYRA